MPTYAATASFDRDYRDLGPEERRAFRTALEAFIEDLTAIEQGRKTSFRKRLRVKSMKYTKGIWEMTWEIRDGRATFEYGPEIETGKRHVVWRRIGGHAIFANP